MNGKKVVLACGLGAALYAFMNAQFRRGIDVVLELQDFAGQVQNADLVITGEGRTDGQTLFGKVPMGVAETAKRQGDIPVCVFSGGVSSNATLRAWPCGYERIFAAPAVSTDNALGVAVLAHRWRECIG